MIRGEFEIRGSIPGAALILRRATEAGISAAATVLQSAIQRSLGGASPSAPGSPPGNQTGRLQRSITVADGGELAVDVGTNLPYAPIHEFGGTISGTMTVPITPRAKIMRRRTRSLRSENLTFIKRGGGRDPLLADTSGGGFEPLFVLKRAVTLAARPFLRPAFNDQRRQMRAAFERAFRKEALRSVIARRT